MNPLPLLLGLLGASAMALVGVLSQVDPLGTNTAAYISGGAAITTSGALAYVVRMIATGKLVHREPATAEAKLLVLLDKVNETLNETLKREDDYREMLISMSKDPRGRKGAGPDG